MNYANGKVYEIVCNITGERYIGSTCQPLSKRLAVHRSNCKSFDESKKVGFTTSFYIIRRGDYAIVLREEVPCENKEQLIRAERRHIESVPCVNKIIPGRTHKEHLAQMREYHDANREHRLIQMREYQEANRERIAARLRQYYAVNRERIAVKNRESYLANHEQRLAYQREYNARKRDEKAPPI